MKRRLAIITALVGLFLAAGWSAFAYWTGHGTGSATKQAGTAAPLTTTTASPTAALYPGATGDVKIVINNTNSFAVTVTDIEGNGAIAADGAHSACTTTGVLFAPQHSRSDVIGAGGSVTLTLSNAASMDTSSLSACQGATFSIPVTITAHH